MIPNRQFLTTEELIAKKQTGGIFLFDVESFENYFLVGFKCYNTGKCVYFESIDNEPVQSDWLHWLITNFCIVGFNSFEYDMPIISMAIAGHSVSALKQATEELILHGLRPDDLKKKYHFDIPFCNHIDLIEVAPLVGSLKVYGARLHCRHLQDLPFDPATVLSREQIAVVRSYNFNDLDNSELLLRELHPHLELRASLSNEFGKDLRSRSDAQLAQEIINGEIARISGKSPKRPGHEKFVGTSFKYTSPDYINFMSSDLRFDLSSISNSNIFIDDNGHVKCPPEIEGKEIIIGANQYRIGMGGLHSKEQRQALITGDCRVLDRDVTGYYPNMILKNNFTPRHLGQSFIEALQNIVDRRYKAKKDGNKVVADSLKIASNGTFGKLSDPYSTLYDPAMMVQTTLTGQLSLLMAIERLTLAGFQVVSANTDGIVTLCPHNRYAEFVGIFQQWEHDTGLETEETEYKGLYSRDVNNYIAIKMDGKHKAKGVYSEVGSALNSPLSKNPTSFVCIDAAVARLVDGTPVENTIGACQRIERFVTVRAVKGGGHKDGRYLGKVIRWYYAENVLGDINYCTSGNKVPLSNGAKPLMILPEFIPHDLDYARYVTLATEILEDIGAQRRRNEQLTLL